MSENEEIDADSVVNLASPETSKVKTQVRARETETLKLVRKSPASAPEILSCGQPDGISSTPEHSGLKRDGGTSELAAEASEKAPSGPNRKKSLKTRIDDCGRIVWETNGVEEKPQAKLTLVPEKAPAAAPEPKPAAERCIPELLPKHQIFLSHSGLQKPFVEQLCVDLENAGQFAFFDQDPDSLPKGAKFGPLIIKAANQCSLAVILLSKEFITSKWPMLELSTFVQSKKKGNPNLVLLPLFYKLLPSDLSEEKVKNEWMKCWEKLIGGDKRTSVELWTDAVSELRGSNGLSFEQYGTSEKTFRDIVVKHICHILPPKLEFDTSNTQGCDRLCKIVSSMFEEKEVDNNKFGCEVLGIYGMGGLGKTTLCQALCNHFQSKFCGRVCHVELKSDRPKDDPALVKLVLRKLTDAREDVVYNIHSKSQGHQFLKSRQKDQPVFLAVDNVEDVESSREEARAYVNAGFPNGSKVLVTSRSEIILKSILNDSKYCKPIPSLNKDEASMLFLWKAAPSRSLQSLSTDEQRIVERCLDHYHFPIEPQSVQQYHPFALRALGVYFHDVDSEDLMTWEKCLNDRGNLQDSRESSYIFDILGLSFKTLSALSKLMFLDLALFVHPFNFHMELNWISSAYERTVEDIARLHDLSFSQARVKMKELERLTLIQVTNYGISMHDLYKEFARWLIQEDVEFRKLCIYLKNSRMAFVQPGGSWAEVKRVRAWALSFRGCPVEKMQWHNLVILDLFHCEHLHSLNLYGLSCLLELRLFCCLDLKEIVFSLGTHDSHEKDINYRQHRPKLLNFLNFFNHRQHRQPLSTSTSGSLIGIQVVELTGLRSLKHIPFLSHCWNLQSLHVHHSTDLALPNLTTCSNLRSLFYCMNMSEALDSGIRIKLLMSNIGKMTNLMYLKFDNFNLASRFDVDFSCLNKLTSLVSLSLPSFHNKEFPIQGVVLPNLVALNLQHWTELLQLPHWNLMPNLRRLCINGCGKIHASHAPPTIESLHSGNYHQCIH